MPDSLLTGKRTGKFNQSVHLVRFLKTTREQIQRLSAKFPTQPEQGIISPEQRILVQEQQIFPVKTEVGAVGSFSTHSG
jgi:hypothetical protein